MNKDIQTAWNYQHDIMDEATGSWNANDHKWSINLSNILTKIIQSTGRYCERYASDMLITWETITNLITLDNIQPTIILFGIRKAGVDSNEFILSQLKTYQHVACYAELYYRQILAVKLEIDDNFDVNGELKATLKDITSHLKYTDSIDAVPDEVTIIFDNKIHMLPGIIRIHFTDETALGEPVAWIYLSDNTSIEVCHEESDLTPSNQYYSIRHHCSEEDFDNDTYKKTMGIISSIVCNDIASVQSKLKDILTEQTKHNISVTSTT